VVSIVAVVPETVQTEVVAEKKAIVNPELAVAARGRFDPTLWPPTAGNVIVCGAKCATTLCGTNGAAA
jgi:hypothetical protein